MFLLKAIPFLARKYYENLRELALLETLSSWVGLAWVKHDWESLKIKFISCCSHEYFSYRKNIYVFPYSIYQRYWQQSWLPPLAKIHLNFTHLPLNFYKIYGNFPLLCAIIKGFPHNMALHNVLCKKWCVSQLLSCYR